MLTLGCIAALLTLVLLCTNAPKDVYVQVSNFSEDGDVPAVGEPDGYIGGEWNLWEFIGDSINRMLFTS